MIYFRQYPWFSGILLFLGLVLATEIGALCERRNTARRAELQEERKRRELEKLLATVPGPTAENAAAIARDLAQTGKALTVIEGQLRGRDRPVAENEDQPRPAKRNDLFFALADFVEKFRARMAALNIGLEPNERFGFSAYANAGPEPGLVPSVQRQHLVVEYLAEALLVARPHRLVAIERERPEGPSGPDRPVSDLTDSRGSPARDLFTINPLISARVKGLIETNGFRVIFIGPTEVLRTFLKQLAGFELPVVVRGIEVESAISTDSLPGPGGNEPTASARAPSSITAAPTSAPAPVPVVMPALSKFTVTVEFIELVPGQPTS